MATMEKNVATHVKILRKKISIRRNTAKKSTPRVLSMTKTHKYNKKNEPEPGSDKKMSKKWKFFCFIFQTGNVNIKKKSTRQERHTEEEEQKMCFEGTEKGKKKDVVVLIRFFFLKVG